MYWKTIDLKDDFYKLSLYYMEDAETKDDIAVCEDYYSTV